MTGLIITFIGSLALGVVIGIRIGRGGLHRHKWSPWTFYRDTDYYNPGKNSTNSLPIRKVKVYTRVCEKCHIPETREIDA